MQRQIVNNQRFKKDQFDQKAIFLCQFCGGQKCQQENYLKNKKQPNAIEGLHSNWITNDILAMQRPSERLIQEYKLYKKMKDIGIGAILNLQQPGQHPYCGDGIIPEIGFSYRPEGFYAHGIPCFSECWEDMTATTFEHMMRIMNVFASTLHQGKKIAVHCHAGRGRTLLVICSWLIYHDRMSPQETIELAVEKRQGVLTRSSQREFLYIFEGELARRRRSFAPHPHDTPAHFTDFTSWQTHSFLRYTQKKLNRLPLLHVKLSKQLRRLASQQLNKVGAALVSATGGEWREKPWRQQDELQLKQYKANANSAQWGWVKEVCDPRIAAELLFDFYEELPSSVVTSLTLDCLKEQLLKSKTGNHLSILLQPEVVHEMGISTVALILDLAHLLQLFGHFQQEKEHRQGQLTKAISLRMSLFLISKRRFFPHIFEGGNPRRAEILYQVKRAGRRVNNDALWLQKFLLEVSGGLPKDFREVQSLIFKAVQVESHLYSLRKQDNKKTLSWGESKTLFEQAKVTSSS